MQKDFDTWNSQKKKLDEKHPDIIFRRREIRWCTMGLNIGYEQDGKGDYYERPVLIIRKLGRFTFIGVPITTQPKQGFIFHHFKLTNGESRVAIIGQLRVFDARRLTTFVDMISREEFFPIIKAVQNLIEPPPQCPPQVGHALPGQNSSDLEANTEIV